MQEEPMIDKIEYADAIKLEKPEPDESDIDHRRHDRFQFWNFHDRPKKVFDMNDITMIFLGNHGFSIGNDLNSGTGYTPGKREVAREPRSYNLFSGDAVHSAQGVRPLCRTLRWGAIR